MGFGFEFVFFRKWWLGSGGVVCGGVVGGCGWCCCLVMMFGFFLCVDGVWDVWGLFC